MVNRTKLALITMVAGVMLFLVSCGDGSEEQAPELSRSDVEAIVRAELDKAPAPTPGAEGGLPLEDVARLSAPNSPRFRLQPQR